MPKIRRAKFCDKYKLKKMISFLSSDEINLYMSAFMNSPFSFFHHLLPLRFKFLPESYVIHEQDEILGMVTVSPVLGNPYKLSIKRLFLEQNCFNAGKQLMEFIIAKYGAKGAYNFFLAIDDNYDELLNLFVNGCGFRQCGTQELWKINNKNFQKTCDMFIRPFKNSDAENVANLFNDSVLTPFKHAVSREKAEYYDPICLGLSGKYKLKYVVEDSSNKYLIAYLSVYTTDNENYIIDLTVSNSNMGLSYEDIFAFIVNQISKRQKNFNLFVKLKKFTTTFEEMGKYFEAKGFEKVQSKAVLSKDFYRIVKQQQLSEKLVLFSEVGGKPAYKACYEEDL